jgi:rhodanese-related sulfurtransferase
MTEQPSQDSAALPLVTAVQVAAELQGGAVILDTRPAEQFAHLHIRGSIQISLLGRFASWAAIIIDQAERVVLIAEDSKSAQEARNRLERVRVEQVIGYSLADPDEWRRAGLELGSIPVERCQEILGALQAVQLIDVRSRAEWLKGHLPGAISMPLLDLDPSERVIDPSRPSLLYCHEGFRATTAASILLRESGAEVGILIDGIEGWSALGLPLEVPEAPESP